MEELVTNILLGDSGVTGLFGDRINWVRRPQGDNQYPALCLQRIAGQRMYYMGGADGLVHARIQLDVWGQTYAEAKNGIRAALGALSAYRGGVIQGSFVDSERDMPDELNEASVRLFRVTADIEIWHTE